MSTTELTQASETSSRRDFLPEIRPYLRGRRGLIAAGAVIVAAGLAFNWSWLVAAGVAPVLLSLLPCLAMCALGLCMNRMVGGSSARQQPATDLGIPTDDGPTATRLAASNLVGPISAGDARCCQSVRSDR
ncbi:hypothetical protein [Mesorhizobium carmichaelinearum]|uniref:hypothetical protein n=1 Tax=Mesorhizobium carmichaelinearum TaxID=1208188 RepID=UPI001FCE5E20|nr:hypothetical protein [Mesorhizobium carmichaelinearum]